MAVHSAPLNMLDKNVPAPLNQADLIGRKQEQNGGNTRKTLQQDTYTPAPPPNFQYPITSVALISIHHSSTSTRLLQQSRKNLLANNQNNPNHSLTMTKPTTKRAPTKPTKPSSSPIPTSRNKRRTQRSYNRQRREKMQRWQPKVNQQSEPLPSRELRSFRLAKKTATQEANPSAANDEEISPSLEIVKFLFEFGCDANVQDSNSWTPLHCAAWCNKVAMVRFLKHGAARRLRVVTRRQRSARTMSKDSMDVRSICKVSV